MVLRSRTRFVSSLKFPASHHRPSAFMGMGQRRYGPEACLLGWRRDGTRSSCGHELRQCWPGLNGRGCTTPVFGPDGKRTITMLSCSWQPDFFARRLPTSRNCCVPLRWQMGREHHEPGLEHNMSSTTCAREWDLVKEDLKNYKTGPDGFEVYGFTGYGMNKSKDVCRRNP